MKIGRNHMCPCGSGKKYKKCCKNTQTLDTGEGNILVDSINFGKKERVILKDNLSENQILKMGPKIAESFDEKFPDELKEISRGLSRAVAPFFIGMQSGELKDEWEIVCMNIIFNAQQTVTSSLATLREGYRFQSAMLIRNVIESIAVVLAIVQDKKYLELYKKGKLDSPKTISVAKKLFPFWGELYGIFCNHFSHIGAMHGNCQRINLFEEDEEPGNFCRACIRLAANCIYITSELVCFRFIPEPLYWKCIKKGQYAYCPSEEILKDQTEFLMKSLEGKN